jgi:hypothetical protein
MFNVFGKKPTVEGIVGYVVLFACLWPSYR